MTPDDESTATADGSDDLPHEPTEEAIEAVEVDTEPLDRAEGAIDEAREAVTTVARTDAIGEDSDAALADGESVSEDGADGSTAG